MQDTLNRLHVLKTAAYERSVNVAALFSHALGPDWRSTFNAIGDASTAPVKKPHPQVYLQMLNAHQRTPLLDWVVSGDSLPTKRPDPACILACLDRFAYGAPDRVITDLSALLRQPGRWTNNAEVHGYDSRQWHSTSQPISASAWFT